MYFFKEDGVDLGVDQCKQHVTSWIRASLRIILFSSISRIRECFKGLQGGWFGVVSLKEVSF